MCAILNTKRPSHQKFSKRQIKVYMNPHTKRSTRLSTLGYNKGTIRMTTYKDVNLFVSSKGVEKVGSRSKVLKLLAVISRKREILLEKLM